MSSTARPMQITQSLLGLLSSLVGVLGVIVGLFAVLPMLVLLVLVLTPRGSQALHAFNFGMPPLDRQRIYWRLRSLPLRG